MESELRQKYDFLLVWTFFTFPFTLIGILMALKLVGLL